MRVLVTGGAGFIGSHIVDQCIAAGHEVAVVDNLWEEGGGKRANLNPRARFYYADITDDGTLQSIFDEVQPEVVSHQAAQHSVSISTKNPKLDARVNVLGLLNVLTNCTRVGVRKVIFASSGATYGMPASLPITEETPQRPESPYGITKLMAEHYLHYWQEGHGLKYTAFRYGNVYGPRQDVHGEAGVVVEDGVSVNVPVVDVWLAPITEPLIVPPLSGALTSKSNEPVGSNTDPVNVDPFTMPTAVSDMLSNAIVEQFWS